MGLLRLEHREVGAHGPQPGERTLPGLAFDPMPLQEPQEGVYIAACLQLGRHHGIQALSNRRRGALRGLEHHRQEISGV